MKGAASLLHHHMAGEGQGQISHTHVPEAVSFSGTGSHNPSPQEGQFYGAAQAKCKVLFPDAAAEKGGKDQ